MLSNATMPSGKQSIKQPTSRLAAVIVVLKQTPSELEECIRGLNNQTLPITHLFIHWNTPQPKKFKHSARFTLHHIGAGKNVGWCDAINAGITAAKKAKCNAILILNTDTRLPPKLLSTLTTELETYKAGAISPTILSPNKTIWYAGAQLFAHLGILRVPRIGKSRSLLRSTQTTDSISGCCCLLSLARCGNARMDTDYFIYWDDPDLSLQLHRQELATLWTNSIAVTHLTGGHAITPFQAYGYMRNGFIFLRRFTPMPVRLIGYTAQIFIVFPYYLLRCRTQKSKANLVRGLLDGVKGKTGIFPKELLP